MTGDPLIDPKAMRGAAGQAVGILKALANEDRLLLLCQLSQGELCVSQLEHLLDIHQPTLSQQLSVLRTERVVATRRDGKRVFYSIEIRPRAEPSRSRNPADYHARTAHNVRYVNQRMHHGQPNRRSKDPPGFLAP